MFLRKSTILSVFFILYLLILVWIIIFKLQLSFTSLPDERTLNLVPFYDGNIERVGIYVGEKIYNLLLFVPFGLYVCLLSRDRAFINNLKPIFLTSLSFEVVQLIFGIGTSDVTDLIMNTLGGAVGIGIFKMFEKKFKDIGYKHALIFTYFLSVLMCLFILFIKMFIKIKVN